MPYLTRATENHWTNDEEDDQSGELDEELGLEAMEKSPLGMFLRFTKVFESGSYQPVHTSIFTATREGRGTNLKTPPEGFGPEENTCSTTRTDENEECGDHHF